VRLIGLHGRYHSGKDEAFTIIDEWAISQGKLAIRHALADALKISGLRSFKMEPYCAKRGIDLLDMANVIKEKGIITISWDDGSHRRAFSITGRDFWQGYGTEAHRADDLGHSFGPDFWIDNLIPLGSVRLPAPRGERPLWWDSFKQDWAGYADFAVIPDVRFPNEATRIHELGGEVWYIDVEERLGLQHDEHSSEAKLDDAQIDRVIDNNGNLEQFRDNVMVALVSD